MFLGKFQDPSELHIFVGRNPNDEDCKFKCKICGKTSRRGSDIRDHVENKHFPDYFLYNCEICNDDFKSKIALKNHRTQMHR